MQHDHQQCLNQALGYARKICQSNGLRLTPLREKVLTLIWQSHQPRKAYDILKELGSNEQQAKPPTVYRALDFLLEHKFIHRLHSLNAYIGCSHPDTGHTSSHECYFLICRECGELSECCSTDIKNTLQHIAAEQGFRPVHSNIEIEGICAQCRN